MSAQLLIVAGTVCGERVDWAGREIWTNNLLLSNNITPTDKDGICADSSKERLVIDIGQSTPNGAEATPSTSKGTEMHAFTDDRLSVSDSPDEVR